MLTRREFGASLAGTALLWRLQASAQSDPPHVYAYVSVGDNQWSPDSLPVDSAATIEAMFEFLSKTFQMKRVYWRGEECREWLQYHQMRPESAFYYDCWTNWLDYLNNQVKTNEIAVAAAHRQGMEIYSLDGLFDFGATGDTGGDGVYPTVHEDRLRIEHPEWCPVDRWGERLAPGSIEFCYPEARQALISRYLHQVTQYGYDGIFFYTYVENCGARYLDEYGFNQPIVKEYERRYGADIRKQLFNKEAWYRLRGEYMTQFIRELHTALAAKGKKLSMGIYPPTPNYPEPWDGGQVDIPPGGNVYMDWEGWVQEGIVDELFVWWRGDQKTLLERMLKVCKGKPVELTVAATKPFDEEWKPFVKAGVTPVSVWAPGFELDRVSPEPSKAEALKSPDWRWRMQALADMRIGSGVTFFSERQRAGGPKADPSAVAALTTDPHVLVRRQAIFALGALQADAYAPLLEAALTDEESSGRIAAAFALAKVNGPESPRRIVAALSKDDKFQMKSTCVSTLVAMKEKAQPVLLEGIKSPSRTLREVCVRALSENGLPSSQRAVLSVLASEETELILFYAIMGLTKHASPEVVRALLKTLGDPRFAVQMWAANSLEEVASALSADEAREALAALEQLFRQFGDGCKRPDAAWGWRTVGNAMLACGQRGREMLETMRTQRQDRWLAWAAYQVLYVLSSPKKIILCEEKEAVENHAKYAPPFPGWRA
jgi:HEAT repeat protein